MRVPDDHQTVGVREAKLVMSHAMDNAVHRRRRPDAEAERKPRDGDHARMAAPHAQGVAGVGESNHKASSSACSWSVYANARMRFWNWDGLARTRYEQGLNGCASCARIG